MSIKILLAHPGTQYSYQLAKELARKTCLHEFWTGFALAKNTSLTSLLLSAMPAAWRKKIANRIVDGIPAGKLKTMPLLEAGALIKLKMGKSPQQVLHCRNRIFQEKIPTASIRSASAIIGFDTSSWILAERARALGKPFFLDRSIAHPAVKNTVLNEVARRFPIWKEEIEMQLPEILSCEEKEHALAAKIVVASNYVKKTLISKGVSEDKIIVNPYGVDLQQFRSAAEPRPKRPFRFLFLGSIIARKGIPLLLEAWQSLALKDWELWLAGPVSRRVRSLITDLPGLKILGSYPHEDMPDLIRQCDVLIFPSYCEGFAQVLLESMASGLPIITTEATAGPELIQDSKEGFLIPPGDLDALRRAMRYFADNPNKLTIMSEAARLRAEQFSWERYGDRWYEILKN